MTEKRKPNPAPAGRGDHSSQTKEEHKIDDKRNPPYCVTRHTTTVRLYLERCRDVSKKKTPKERGPQPDGGTLPDSLCHLSVSKKKVHHHQKRSDARNQLELASPKFNVI